MLGFWIKVVLISLFLQIQLLKGQHFTPVFWGNPYNPMNILVTNVSIDSKGIEIGDEIGIFDESVCVGAFKYNGEKNIGITVSMDDPTTPKIDGFKYGNPIIFKIWKLAFNFEYGNIQTTFSAVFDSLYVPFGTSLIDLQTSINDQKPKILPNQSFYVKEDAILNTPVGQINLNSLENIRFKIVQTEASKAFKIDSLSGLILVNKPELIDYNIIKNYFIPVIAYNYKNNFLSDTSICSIELIRTPPYVHDIENDTALVGSHYKQVISVVGASSKILSIIPNNLPSWMNVDFRDNNTILFEGIPSSRDIGVSKVKFSVSDNTTLIQKEFNINIIQSEPQPEVSINSNPTQGPFSLQFNSIINPEIKIVIRNINGLVVYTKKIEACFNGLTLDIDLTGNAKSMYFIEIINNNSKITKRILFQ